MIAKGREDEEVEDTSESEAEAGRELLDVGREEEGEGGGVSAGILMFLYMVG